MSEMPPEVTVIVEPPLPEINVSVEAPAPDVEVTISDLGVPGPPGPPGPPGESGDASILTHIESLTPHPVYDDGPSFALLYENAKV